MDEKPIGRLWPHPEGGHVVIGYCCLTQTEVHAEGFVPVYYVNIGPLYSQHCYRCGRELVKGTSDVELFEGPK